MLPCHSRMLPSAKRRPTLYFQGRRESVKHGSPTPKKNWGRPFLFQGKLSGIKFARSTLHFVIPACLRRESMFIDPRQKLSGIKFAHRLTFRKIECSFNFKYFPVSGQIPAAGFGDGDHVFDSNTPSARIIKAGFDCDNMSFAKNMIEH